MFLHFLRLSFMQKIRKIYRAVFRENGVRQTERQRDRDGPEYKGPPDAIAKPSDPKSNQKRDKSKWEENKKRKFDTANERQGKGCRGTPGQKRRDKKVQRARMSYRMLMQNAVKMYKSK